MSKTTEWKDRLTWELRDIGDFNLFFYDKATQLVQASILQTAYGHIILLTL